MTLTPTPEQDAITRAFQEGDHLVVQAGAGTGKTSTLRILAAADPTRRGLYIAYNRAIATDATATFPRNVQCSTAHGLAYRALGYQYRDRLNGPRVPAWRTAQLLGLTDDIDLDDGHVIQPKHLARLVMDTVARFCHSADQEPALWHVPPVPGLSDNPGWNTLRSLAVGLARRAWSDLQHPNGKLRYTHDCYLKQWQLTGPQLAVDFMLLDEAQDANPVITAIVNNQHNSQRVLVGDQCQAIYRWRGATNAMATAPGQRLDLTQSFRFGPAIADEANKWLAFLDADLRLSGYDQIPSTVGYVHEPAAILCRSNAGTITELIHAAGTGRRAALVGGGGELKRLAEAAGALRTGQRTDHPDLFAFTTWDEVREYVQHDGDGSDLAVFVKIIDQYGSHRVIEILERTVDEHHADVVVSTAHKAKGREWDTVTIAGDFMPRTRGDDGEPVVDRDAAMLAYVAVTRARTRLNRGPLNIINDLVAVTL